MKTHELKCWPEYFEAIQSDAKPFEVRRFDRPYAVGDTLRLREYDPKTGDYTGREVRRKISYLLDLTYLPGEDKPIYGGYVVLGLSRPAPENKALTCEGCVHEYCEGYVTVCDACTRVKRSDLYRAKPEEDGK